MYPDIRTATARDLGVIHGIRRDAIVGIAPEFGDREAWADRRSADFFAPRVDAGNVRIASVDGEDVGWGSIDGAEITGLYVRTSRSGCGVGRRLMARLEADIRRTGSPYATLEASPNAIGFYVKLGYRAVGEMGHDGAVVMRKAL